MDIAINIMDLSTTGSEGDQSPPDFGVGGDYNVKVPPDFENNCNFFNAANDI